MGEKKRRLAAMPPGRRAFDARFLARAFEALEAGDRARAAAAFETLQANLPGRPRRAERDRRPGLAAGEPQRGSALLRARSKLNRREPVYRCHLAIAYRSLGKPDLAIAELETALGTRSRPRRSAFESRQPPAGAWRQRRRAAQLRARARDPARLSRCAHTGSARRVRAGKLCRGLCATSSARWRWSRNSTRPGTTCREPGRRRRPAGARDGAAVPRPRPSRTPTRAREHPRRAAARPRNPAYWTQFERCVRTSICALRWIPRVRDLLLRALDHRAVDPARLVRPIASLSPRVPTPLDIAASAPAPGSFDGPRGRRRGTSSRGVLGDPLLRRLLEIVVPNLFIERLIGFARRGLLREIRTDPRRSRRCR